MRFDRKTFFTEYRRQWGSLPQSRLDALEDLLPAIEADDIRDLRYIAYMLATAAHETDWTFRPIHERGGRSYFNKYETGTRLGRQLGNTQPDDGYRYRGRGFVQLTGRVNYAKASRKLGVDFVGDPDAVLDMHNAYQIMSIGIREGWFTGKSLAAYISTGSTDYHNARRIINGLDRATDIAGYAKNFERILRAALTQDAPRKAQAESQAREPSPPAQVVEQQVAVVPVAAVPAASLAPIETQTVTPIAPQESTSAKGWLATKYAALTGAGLSLSTIVTMFTGVTIPEPVRPYLVIIILAGVLLTGIVLLSYQISKMFLTNAREKRADQMTLELAKIAADRSKNTVVLQPAQLPGSEVKS